MLTQSFLFPAGAMRLDMGLVSFLLIYSACIYRELVASHNKCSQHVPTSSFPLHTTGLPHTDENFNNPDLGNCLDYTVTPKNNMHPDESNYRRLASIYGTVGGGGRKLLRENDHNDSKRQPFSREVLAEYRRAMKELHDYDGNQPTSWTMVETHERGRSYHRYLGEDHQVQIHALHPRP